MSRKKTFKSLVTDEERKELELVKKKLLEIKEFLDESKKKAENLAGIDNPEETIILK